MTPTALTLNYLRRSGYSAGVVERWIPHVERRADLFGFGDVLAVHNHRQPSILLVQCTWIDHVGDRLAKAKSRPALRTWLRAGGAFEVWGWTQRGDQWQVKRLAIGVDDLREMIVEAPARRRPRLNQPALFQ